MNVAIDSASLVSELDTSTRSVARATSVAASGEGKSGSSGASVKVAISVALLKKSRDLNAELADELISALPGIK